MHDPGEYLYSEGPLGPTECSKRTNGNKKTEFSSSFFLLRPECFRTQTGFQSFRIQTTRPSFFPSELAENTRQTLTVRQQSKANKQRWIFGQMLHSSLFLWHTRRNIKVDVITSVEMASTEIQRPSPRVPTVVLLINAETQETGSCPSPQTVLTCTV